MGRKLELFEPREQGHVSLYSCGVTVYSYAHIGNMRAYIFVDTLRRTLEYNGYEVRQVRNITDVGHLTSDDLDTGEDKVEGAARRQHKTPQDIASFYAAAFLEDTHRLNIEDPEWAPRATEYIDSMISLVQRLIDAGVAYPAGGNVFYDVSSFPHYGALSGNTIEGLEAGARVEVDESKRAPADFALWKAAGPDKLMRWESPWGSGVPGWHLECSAMAMDLLGEQIDIHTGGVDHVFPHHEDEIAQSEGATGEQFARYWLHNEFLQLPNEAKMSKSSGNFLTLSDLMERGVHPLAFRYFTFQANYRTQLAFSWVALEAAQVGLARVWQAIAELVQAKGTDELTEQTLEFQNRFRDSINRDLDMPGALAVLHDVLGSKLSAGEKRALLQDFDRVLALDLLAMGEKLSAVTEEETQLLRQRAEARSNRDWSLSDELRTRLAAGGLEVKDTAAGQRWVRLDVLTARGQEDREDAAPDTSGETTNGKT